MSDRYIVRDETMADLVRPTGSKAAIRALWEIIEDRARRDEHCWCCGWPFDTNQRVYVTAQGLGDVFCSLTCADKSERLRTL